MRPLIYVSSIALAVVMAMPAVASEKVGVNAAIRNHVEMKTDADAALRPAVVREPVHLGDLIASGPNSAMQMLLLDHSVFTVGANARMTIDRFVYDPDRGTTDIAASVARGAFRFMSGRLNPGAGKSAIRTPVATIGVRGTIVEGAVGQDVLDILAGQPGVPPFTGDPSNAVLILLNGPGRDSGTFDKPGAIDVTGDNGGTTSIEHGGVAVLFLPGQPLYGPFPLSDDAYAKLQALLNANPSPDEQGAPDNGSADVDSGGILNIGDFNSHFLQDPQQITLPFPIQQEGDGQPPIDTFGGGGRQP